MEICMSEQSNDATSQRELQELRIERAMQWVLDDLFNNKEPHPEDWALIPQGNALEAFEALNKAFPDGSQAVKKVFNSLIKIESHRWLITLRNKKLPPRDVEGNSIPLVGTLLSDVTPKSVQWLWYGRLPLGKLVMLDGDPGLGKTTVMFDIAARLTKGMSMPYETGPAVNGGVVLICLEDGLEDTIQPRLARAGADLTKIVSIGYIPDFTQDGVGYDRPFNLSQDLSLLEAAIERVKAKLVIIDPIMAILGGKDTYKDNEVRSALAPLKALVERTGVCAVMIRHITKSGGDKLIYQGGGSVAFIGLARVGLMVLKNPDNEEQVVFVNPKNNLNGLAPKLLYRIISNEDDHRPHIQWEGVTTISDSELTGKTQDSQGETRQEVLKCLRLYYPNPMTYQQIAEELDLDESVVKNTLTRMVKQNQIERAARNTYVALSGLS
jgi:hypothetical protein